MNPPDHKIHFVEYSTDVYAACGAFNPVNVSAATKHTTCARCRRTAIYSLCEAGDARTEENWGAKSATLPKTSGKRVRAGKSASTWKGDSTWKGAGSAATYKPCYHSHPPYEITTGITILGGSGVDPIHTDCDVYISLEARREPGPKNLPWSPGFDIVFPVKDFKVPDSAVEFRKLVDWTADQLRAGAKVHAGCMMGHGRTGMLLAALRATMHGPEQAIQHVRANYCKKAVDTLEQVKWLVKHFGVDMAPERERGPYLFDKGKGVANDFKVTSVQAGSYHGDTWGSQPLHVPVHGKRNNDDDWLRREGESVEDWLLRTRL